MLKKCSLYCYISHNQSSNTAPIRSTLPTNETLTLVTLDDRRATVRATSAKFLYQSELRTLIYRNANYTGALYRLVTGKSVELSAKRAMVAQMSLASSGSTFGVDGMCADVPYTPMIAAASLASMHVAHLAKRTVW